MSKILPLLLVQIPDSESLRSISQRRLELSLHDSKALNVDRACDESDCAFVLRVP